LSGPALFSLRQAIRQENQLAIYHSTFSGMLRHLPLTESPLVPAGRVEEHLGGRRRTASSRALSRSLAFSFMVSNTGAVDGTDIPQVYLGALASPGVDVADKVLAGFDRIELATRHL